MFQPFWSILWFFPNFRRYKQMEARHETWSKNLQGFETAGWITRGQWSSKHFESLGWKFGCLKVPLWMKTGCCFCCNIFLYKMPEQTPRHHSIDGMFPKLFFLKSSSWNLWRGCLSRLLNKTLGFHFEKPVFLQEHAIVRGGSGLWIQMSARLQVVCRMLSHRTIGQQPLGQLF